MVGGSHSWPSWQNDLTTYLFQSVLSDLRQNGYLFTWSNRQDKAPIMKKLDQVLANLTWECDFSGSEAYLPPSGVSDHSPMVVTLAALPSQKTPFKFFDIWAEHPQFLSVVAKAWAIDVKGSSMYQLCHKLKHLKGELKKFSKEFFANLPRRVVRAKEALKEVQRMIQHHPLDSTFHTEESRLIKDYLELSRAEESFLKQKAQWLNLGDKNSKFFFQSMKLFQSRSKITSISTDDGARVETPGEVSDTIVQFFQNLLGFHEVAGVDEDMLQRVLPRQLTEIQREDLDRSVLDDEIKMVMFSLKDPVRMVLVLASLRRLGI
ncbi:uncharacterized protein LOC120106861 [Phoenix dactylifera]|uniref:Uncharacterized protein LOC120106861 n=1 Tax=Phoenix dactylifera TaxID=42345 RepID=A0A8B8ZNU1_PHODC|nr:uncharacterized protein LOC120106861 [Phoenix dactylifera]